MAGHHAQGYGPGRIGMTTIAASGTMPIRPADRTSSSDVPLEPTDSSVFEPKTPTQLNKNIHAVLFGGMGAAFLGLSAAALSQSLRVPIAKVALTGAGIALGGAVGGWMGLQQLDASFRKYEQGRIPREVGASTLQTARDMIASFDESRNGRIETATEQTREEPFLLNGLRQMREFSAEKVWSAADTDPADGTVTDIELARLMSNFDTDRSGTISVAERNAFDDTHDSYLERARPY